MISQFVILIGFLQGFQMFLKIQDIKGILKMVYLKIVKIVPYHLEKALNTFKSLKDWSKFGALLQFDHVKMVHVDSVTMEFKWYLQQIRKETSVSGFNNGRKFWDFKGF